MEKFLETLQNYKTTPADCFLKMAQGCEENPAEVNLAE